MVKVGTNLCRAIALHELNLTVVLTRISLLQTACHCKEGFYKDGKNCELINLCKEVHASA